MEYNTYQGLLKLLTAVKDNNIEGNVNRFTYVLNPYVSSLGYDTINFSKVTNNAEKGYIECEVTSDVSILFTLNDKYEGTREQGKIWVYLDVDTATITLKLNVLNKWRDSFSVDLVGDNAEENFEFISRYTESNELVNNLNEYGNKFLSDGALTYSLIKDNLNNDFVKEILKKEILSPSTEWMEVIAKGLEKEYSLESSQKVLEMLLVVMKNGLTEILEIKDDNKTEIKPENNVILKKEENKQQIKVTPEINPVAEKKETTSDDGYADLSKMKDRLMKQR